MAKLWPCSNENYVSFFFFLIARSVVSNSWHTVRPLGISCWSMGNRRTEQYEVLLLPCVLCRLSLSKTAVVSSQS